MHLRRACPPVWAAVRVRLVAFLADAYESDPDAPGEGPRPRPGSPWWDAHMHLVVRSPTLAWTVGWPDAPGPAARALRARVHAHLLRETDADRGESHWGRPRRVAPPPADHPHCRVVGDAYDVPDLCAALWAASALPWERAVRDPDRRRAVHLGRLAVAQPTPSEPALLDPPDRRPAWIADAWDAQAYADLLLGPITHVLPPRLQPARFALTQNACIVVATLLRGTPEPLETE